MLNNAGICKKTSSFLLNKKLITIKQLQEINQEPDLEKIGFINYLVENDYIDSTKFMLEISKFLHLQCIDLDCIDISQLQINKYFSKEFCDKNKCFPIFLKNNSLYIAIENPINSQNITKEFQQKYSLNVSIIIAETIKIKNKINELNEYIKDLEKQSDKSVEDAMFSSMEDLEVNLVTVEDEDSNIISDDNDSAPIIKFVNGIVIDAIQKGASDIHFEPYEKSYRVRYRMDGILQEILRTKKSLAPKITSRLKIMSALDIAEKRIPQDGKFKIALSANRGIDFRVSTCPVAFGEKVVLRIIDAGSTKIPIEALGFAEHQKELYLRNIKSSQGLVLVTGPTGSGKTVTLYTGLNILNNPEKNISTAEDPVELALEGLNQVQVNNKQGLTFAAALKSFLRQDPDIIMLGEIRDIETGSIAIKASQTGHLVMSTLHTNSAPETLNRLVDMGLPRYNIATSVTLIIAQRLARKLCPHCKIEDEKISFPNVVEENNFTEDILEEYDFSLDDLKEATIYKANPKGCPKCFRGYKGRLGLYEVMPVTKSISRMILEDKNTMEIAKQAQLEGVCNIRQSAIIRVADGLIPMDEVLRVTM